MIAWRVPAAIVIGAVLIAAAIMVVGRWDYRTLPEGNYILRIDRWSGEAALCIATLPGGNRVQTLGCYPR